MNLWDIPERPDMEARIADLEADLRMRQQVIDEFRVRCHRAEARLAAVIALCQMAAESEAAAAHFWTAKEEPPKPPGEK